MFDTNRRSIGQAFMWYQTHVYIVNDIEARNERLGASLLLDMTVYAYIIYTSSSEPPVYDPSLKRSSQGFG